jgi:hypothetical protein
MTIAELADIEIPLTTTDLIRLAGVRDGIVAGMSKRQIARDCGCDEGTIRRDFKKLCLPKEDLDKILSGAKYEPIKSANILREEEAERNRLAAERARQRIIGLDSEKESGQLSHALKGSIVKVLDNYSLNKVTKLHILELVEGESFYLRDKPEDWYTTDHSEVIASYMPAVFPDCESEHDFVDSMIMWLAHAEPKYLIRNRGILKAIQTVKKIQERTCRTAYHAEMVSKGLWRW